MNRQAAIARLKAEEETVRSLGATALFVYGSAARDEAGPASDIDLFVDYDDRKGISLLDLVGIKQELEDKLGVPVDIATRDSLHPRLKKRIEASAIRVF